MKKSQSQESGRETITRRQVVARAVAFALSFLGARTLAAEPTAGRSEGSWSALRAPWDPGFELSVTFRIGDPRNTRARRPYVAVYIETPDGKAVRTITLWARGATGSWLRELHQWYVSEGRRRAGGLPSLTPGITGATRPPGTYTVVWDGKTNEGEYVEQGRYALCIESVRQSAGGAHLVTKELAFGTTPFTEELQPVADIQNVIVEYRKRK